MKRLFLIAILLIVVATICSCHHARRQYHKMIDGIHEVFLEGT